MHYYLQLLSAFSNAGLCQTMHTIHIHLYGFEIIAVEKKTPFTAVFYSTPITASKYCVSKCLAASEAHEQKEIIFVWGGGYSEYDKIRQNKIIALLVCCKATRNTQFLAECISTHAASG